MVEAIKALLPERCPAGQPHSAMIVGDPTSRGYGRYSSFVVVEYVSRGQERIERETNISPWETGSGYSRVRISP